MPGSTRMVAEGDFVEWAPVFGHRYGTPKAPVKAALKAGRDILFDIDWQGTQQLQAAMGEDLVRIFILPPSMAELERRLHARGTDSEDVIADRMARAASEISHWPEYDYVLVNRDTAECLAEVRAIVAAERLKRSRQVGMVPFVRDLVTEALVEQRQEVRRGEEIAPLVRPAPLRPLRPSPIARAASARRG